jgi:hypothetical protein
MTVSLQEVYPFPLLQSLTLAIQAKKSMFSVLRDFTLVKHKEVG